MKVCIVLLLVLVAVAVATPVDKRLVLDDVTRLAHQLVDLLRSHSGVTESVCEAACHAAAGTYSYLCPAACKLAVEILNG